VAEQAFYAVAAERPRLSEDFGGWSGQEVLGARGVGQKRFDVAPKSFVALAFRFQEDVPLGFGLRHSRVVQARNLPPSTGVHYFAFPSSNS
jgi:hypothetical protein